MTVVIDETAFPNNIVLFLKDELRTLIDPAVAEDEYPGITVLTRPIRVGDPVQALAVVAATWMPDLDSTEMIGLGGISGSPISQYLVGIQTFIQHTSEEEGLRLSATLAGAVRNSLLLQPSIKAGLLSLTSSEFGFTETAKRAFIQNQRFLSNEIDKQFYHLSNLELVVETETNAF